MAGLCGRRLHPVAVWQRSRVAASGLVRRLDAGLNREVSDGWFKNSVGSKEPLDYQGRPRRLDVEAFLPSSLRERRLEIGGRGYVGTSRICGCCGGFGLGKCEDVVDLVALDSYVPEHVVT